MVHLFVILKPVIEVATFWFAYYLLFVYIQDSGMVQTLVGLVILVLFFFAAQVLGLQAVQWVLSHIFQISILGFLIIFQPELRRGLTRIGQSPLFKIFSKEARIADEIVTAAVALSKNKIGALVAIERQVGLKPFIETGIALDGVLSSELLITIFTPNAPFHDGGAIIQGARVVAVGCLFPLSQSQKLSKTLGTRHRAGLGLSEETDAMVIVVSEETGVITMMHEGKMNRGVDEETLRQQLMELYQSDKPGSKPRRGGRKEVAG